MKSNFPPIIQVSELNDLYKNKKRDLMILDVGSGKDADRKSVV